jgi:hypothetical protein
MDRARIEAWLNAKHRTFRWPTDENADHYEAVETTDDGLRWFAWSHLHGEDGLTHESLQSWAELEADGPARPMPPEVERALRDWISARR